MRITRDEMLMDIAGVMAKRGTCSRLQVGAVFSRDGRIVSMGYNGAPANMRHCIHETFIYDQHDSKPLQFPGWMIKFLSSFEGTDYNISPGTVYTYDGHNIEIASSMNEVSGCEQAEHAERNAIAWAARHGLALEDTEVHVTHMPCLACSRTLINAGVLRVTYLHDYRIRDGIRLLAEAGVEIRRYDPENGEARSFDPRNEK